MAEKTDPFILAQKNQRKQRRQAQLEKTTGPPHLSKKANIKRSEESERSGARWADNKKQSN